MTTALLLSKGPADERWPLRVGLNTVSSGIDTSLARQLHDVTGNDLRVHSGCRKLQQARRHVPALTVAREDRHGLPAVPRDDTRKRIASLRPRPRLRGSQHP